ncbi:MAG: Rpn family recombination-promoting nuclease/putative transposase [Candidatus Kapabacteria bacterium]|jgi:predicted transposase/invertase (TIGR01784 family)|nr:Rpn family recombination-promoting nuclease/putative transposase [Candidatus Kapabacteria bacterium]
MRTDSFYYKLFQLLPEVLLLLAGADTTRAREYRFHSVEVKDFAFRLDGVLALAEYHDVFFFVEVQYQKDKHLYHRLFAEIMTFLYQQRPKGEWQIVVIFPKRSIDTGVPPDFREYHSSGRLNVVYLDELPQSLTDRYPLTLLQLVNAPSRKEIIAPLAREVLTEAMQNEEEPDRRAEFERLVARIISVKLPKLSIEEIRAMTEPLLSDFEKTRVYREILARGIAKGEAKGERRGLSQGLNQGISLGQRKQQETSALNFLAIGLSVADVAKGTGLSEAEVRTLQQQATKEQPKTRRKPHNS